MRLRYGILALAVGLTAGCGDVRTPNIFTMPSRADQREAEYTILLYVLKSVDHADRIQSFKTQTERDTGWKGLFVVTRADHSELYWGKYANHKQASKNLAKAKKYRTPLGVKPYAQAIILPLPASQPGPPEWNLKNADGAYTVVVATFHDVPEANYFGRKGNAVAYCRQLRQKGKEAYFHHGPANSLVTIGTFGQGAVRMVQRGDRRTPQILDQGIIAIQREFPYLAVNGRQELTVQMNPATGRIEKVPDKTYPARIPKGNDGQGSDGLHSIGNAQLR